MKRRKKKKLKKLPFIVLILLLISIVCCTIYFSSNIILNLNGEELITINIGEEYQEEGATAKYLFYKIDNIEIDNKVDTNNLGTYEVTYSVNFLKKSKSIKRTVEVVDPEAPIIELKGQSTVKLYTDSTYREAGYSASDSLDGDLTSKVTVTNNINNKEVGTYKVTYEVTDSSNNKTTKERTVLIQARPKENSEHGLPVLMYHFFYDSRAGEVGKDGNFVDVVEFEEEMKYLIDNDYYFPTWQEVYDYVDNKTTLPEKSVVITVDDGDESFFRLALPILQKYNIEATSFVITSWTWQEFLDSHTGVRYETHTHNMHRGGCAGINHGGLFNCISHDAGVADLKKSIEMVGDNMAIAYPFGDVNDNVKSITRDAGIKLGFTTVFGRVHPGMDKLALPRVRISGGIGMDKFKERI